MICSGHCQLTVSFTQTVYLACDSRHRLDRCALDAGIGLLLRLVLLPRGNSLRRNAVEIIGLQVVGTGAVIPETG